MEVHLHPRQRGSGDVMSPTCPRKAVGMAPCLVITKLGCGGAARVSARLFSTCQPVARRKNGNHVSYTNVP